MPDYPIPPAAPPRFAGPKFPFSRALSSGPLGELMASIAGTPGDFQKMFPSPPPEARTFPAAQSPTMADISRAQAQQNAAPPDLNYQTLYSMLPEMAMLLRGAPTPASVPAWLKDTSWLTNIIGERGAPPPWASNLVGGAPTPQQTQATQAPPIQSSDIPAQGWTLQKMWRDLVGGSKPAYGADDMHPQGSGPGPDPRSYR